MQNLGRSAGEALHGFVAAAVDAFMAGYTFDKVNLQIAVSGQSVELEAKPSLERLVRASVQSREVDRHVSGPSIQSGMEW